MLLSYLVATVALTKGVVIGASLALVCCAGGKQMCGRRR
jgi:hypothetical protein